MAKFYLVVNNGYSVQDNPEPEEWVKPIAAAGARYIEYFADHMDPLFAQRVVARRSAYFQATMRTLRKHKIKVVSVGTGRLSYLVNVLSHPYPDMAEEGLRWCKAMVDEAVAMGARFIAGHYDYISQSDLRQWSDKHMARLYERLRRLAAYAKRKGLEAICLEQMYTPHLKPYTVAEGKEMLETLNARTVLPHRPASRPALRPAVRPADAAKQPAAVPFIMHADTGHMAVAAKEDKNHTAQDKDPYYWLRQTYGGMKKIFVHLQQTDAASSKHWPFTPQRNKQGIIEAKKVIQAIEDSGVEEAFLSFEILYPRGTTIDRITPEIVESVRHFEKTFADMGYRVKDGVCVKAR